MVGLCLRARKCVWNLVLNKFWKAINHGVIHTSCINDLIIYRHLTPVSVDIVSDVLFWDMLKVHGRRKVRGALGTPPPPPPPPRHYLYPRLGPKINYLNWQNYLANQIKRKIFDYPTIFYQEKKLPIPDGKDKTNFCNVKTIASQDSVMIPLTL